MGSSDNFTFQGRPAGLIDSLNQRIEYTNHFLFVNDEDWVVTADGTPVIQIADAEGGWLQLATDAANDNDEVYMSSGEAFKFDANQPVAIFAQVKLTEQSTNKANILFGLTDAGGANTLQDNGAGPPASYSGAVLFKVDGTLLWYAEASKAAAQSTLALADAPAFVSGTEYEIGFVWDGAALHFYVDGTEVHTVSDSTYLSTTEMTPTIGLKNGGAGVETLYMDWLVIRGKR